MLAESVGGCLLKVGVCWLRVWGCGGCLLKVGVCWLRVGVLVTTLSATTPPVTTPPVTTLTLLVTDRVSRARLVPLCSQQFVRSLGVIIMHRFH